MYALNNGTQQSNNTFTELTGGTYTIIVTNTNNGCSSSDTVRINNTNSSINVTALANAPCENDTLKLTATSETTEGVTFKWINTNGDTLFYVQNPIIPNVTTDNAGTYTVIATETATGCIANNSVTVTVKVLPTASISGDTVICQGETETLTATGGTGYSYLWSTEETSQSIEVNSANTYTVTVTDANNCSKADTFSLSIRDSVSITTTPISVCPDEDEVTVSATFLNATENYSVTWTANNSGDTHEISYPQQTDSYDITIPNNLCDDSLYYTVQYSDGICTASKTDFVHVVDTVAPTFVAPGNINICRNADGTFDADTSVTGSPYNLYDNCLSLEELTISYSDSSTSYIQQQDTIFRIWTVADNCQGTISVQQILVNPVLRETLAQTICYGSTYAFGDSILSEPGTYYDTTRTDNGCDSVTVLTLNVNDIDLLPLFFVLSIFFVEYLFISVKDILFLSIFSFVLYCLSLVS